MPLRVSKPKGIVMPISFVLWRETPYPCLHQLATSTPLHAKIRIAGYGAATLIGHGANLVHSVLHLPRQPPVSPSPKGDTSMATIVRRIGKNGQTCYRAQVRRKSAPWLTWWTATAVR